MHADDCSMLPVVAKCAELAPVLHLQKRHVSADEPAGIALASSPFPVAACLPILQGKAAMRAASQLAAAALQLAGGLVQPGVTTEQLDVAVHDFIIAHGAYPSPLGYHGFPKSICTSVNEVVCHGIPDSRCDAQLPCGGTNIYFLVMVWGQTSLISCVVNRVSRGVPLHMGVQATTSGQACASLMLPCPAGRCKKVTLSMLM